MGLRFRAQGFPMGKPLSYEQRKKIIDKNKIKASCCSNLQACEGSHSTDWTLRNSEDTRFKLSEQLGVRKMEHHEYLKKWSSDMF